MNPKTPVPGPGAAARAATAATASLPQAVADAARGEAGGAVAEAGDNIGVIPVPKSLQRPAVAGAALSKNRTKSPAG